ncbi:MAG: DUF3108 domain-containing protein [Rhodospirillaceae bacterium]|nr:DUF3108 domain-containing protein [Rhodospirillaceae bacterium]
MMKISAAKQVRAAGCALILAVALIIPAAGVAKTGENGKTTHLLYEAYWGGLHVADLALSMQNHGDKFHNRLKLETRGLTKFISNIALKASSSGKVLAGGTYAPTVYRTDYSNRKHFRWVKILFNNDGDGDGENSEPAEAHTGTRPLPGKLEKWNPKDKGPEKLDKVADEMLLDVVDPFTALAQSIFGMGEHLKGGPDHFSIKSFDGKRRFDFDVEYMGVATRTVNDKKHNTYHMRITPRPIAGFKKRHKIFWTGAAFDFYLSRDGSFAPIQIAPLKHGPVLNLKSVCNVPCKIPDE